MSTTTTPITPVSAPQAPQAKPMPTGEAVHKDLYKHAADPAKERERLRGEARTLGLGFFVFFSLIIGGLSLSFNGLLDRGFVAQVQAPAKQRADDAALKQVVKDRAAVWSMRWSNGERTNVALVDAAGTDADDPERADVRDLTRVRVQAIDAEDRIATLGALWTSTVPGQRVVALDMEGVAAPAVPSAPHAVRSAKILFRTIPTHWVISVGAVMGLLGVLVPGLLIPFYKVWMQYVAAPLGFINTRIILGIVFFLMFTPMALALWVRRRFKPETDALGRAERPGSYWKQRDLAKRPAKHFERTF